MTHRPLAAALIAATTFAGVCALPAPEAGAYPRPSVVVSTWNLDFEYQTPQAIMVPDLTGQPRWYWFMPYKVTNHTGQDRLFIPEVTIYTDQGQIITAGQNVPSNVFPAIARRLGNELLESPIEVVGQLLRGTDYARESVAIWPAFEGGDVDRFTVFVGGLSGETQTVRVPGSEEEVLVRRTKAIDFGVPGSYPTPQNQPVNFIEERDVMR